MENQPAPIPTDGDSMHDLVCHHVTHSPNFETGEKLRMIAALNERKDIGLERYGTVLQAHNGRDFTLDAHDEIFDFVVYWRGVLEEDGGNKESLLIYELGLRLAAHVATYKANKEEK